MFQECKSKAGEVITTTKKLIDEVRQGEVVLSLVSLFMKI